MSSWSNGMTPEQEARLALALCATAEAIGQTLTANAARVIAGDLAQYPSEAVAAALKVCRQELTGRLTLAAILQRLHAADGRPGKDEAWSIALSACDEYDTVVMTEEIQLALNAARPVLEAGDKIGARMAFIGAYERLVSQARAKAQPAQWSVSIGFDPGRRVVAIAAAVQMQRIPQERGQLLLADLTHEPITPDGQAVAGLLTGPVSQQASAKVREKLQAIKAQITNRKEAREVRRLESKAQAAQDLARRRAELAKQGQGA